MKIFTKLSFLIVALCCWGVVGYGQVTIAIQDFDGGTPTWSYSGGTTATGNGLFPATPKYVSSSTGRQVTDDGVDIIFGTLDVSSYTSLNFEFRLASFAGTSGNGSESSDYVYVSVSTDGGTTYSQELKIEGNNNAKWGFSGTNAGTGIASTVYDGDDSATTFTPASGGYRTSDGYSFISVTNLPSSSDLRIKLEILNNSGNETWVVDDAMLSGIVSTIDPEPTNHPTTFISDTGTPPTSVIEMVWDDATGAQLPAGYVIKANTTGTFSDPVDGTDPTEDTDLSDGTALVKVAQGTEFYSFSGLDGSTQYYFKIWPYTNAGANIDFKTDGTPLEDDTTTEAECGITNLGSASISCDSNTSGDDNDFVTISLDYTGVDAGAVLAILAGGSSESNTGDDPTADTDGTISFAALEGDAWSVTITGGNCNLSQSGSVLSSECDPVPTVADIRINEIDADTPGSDTQEFIELYSPGAVNFSLDGLVLVLFNGSSDNSYDAFDLDGYQTDADGYFIIGSIENAEIDVAPGGSGWLQNGADAVALYFADGSDFPNGTAATTTDLIDALVYDTNDGDDSGLLTALGQSDQINENENGNSDTESIQRGSWFVSLATPRAMNVLLPVEITSFTAKAINNQTHLSFTTATEENNSHFLIQRSTDEGKTFETIGQVDGKGNSNSTVDYKFVDTKPTAGMNYYRLQQFDFDGTNEFFGPVAVRFGGEVADAPVIWPVPARDRLQIQLPASDSDWQLEVFDLNGRRLLQKTTEEKGINTFFDLNSLPAGSYFLRWSNGSQSGQERFLKV